MASLLKRSSDPRKPMSAIIGSAYIHEPSSCVTAPRFVSTTTAADGTMSFWNRMSTTSNTRFTRSGGCLSCLRRPISLAVIAFSAFSASSSAGLAASRSCSTESFCELITSASPASVSFTACTSAFFFSALAVDAVISCSSTADFSCATTSVFSLSLSSIFIFSTSAAASSSFSSPTLIESASTEICSSFLTYTFLYSSMKPRYDLGVT
mmetsp:Transcript_60685/g.166247  ORF Transcript_60685/g.166247 Transcript_60685/m.166247 type:complete len:209 (+) Transcript_60685:2298-2924(+)